MMRLFPRQRLRLALFLCPTLRAFNGLEAARALDLPCDWLQFGAMDAAGQAKAAAKQQPLLQEVRILHKANGELRVRGNRYWSEWMTQCAGEKVIVNFDPEDIHADVLIYSGAGQFMGPAKHREKAGFFDLDAAAQVAATVDVEVQLEAGGRWMPGRLINGKLHWVRPIPTVAELEAICAAYERANQKVPAAIAALLPQKDQQVADGEIRPASQARRDPALNSGVTNLRFRFPQSDRRGARL